jgi:hypothetical protein
MPEPHRSHFRMVIRVPPRSATLFVVGLVLLIAWVVIDPLMWSVGIVVAGLLVAGILQMFGRIPSI